MIAGAGAAASCWIGWDVAALLTLETAAGLGLAVAGGPPDDEISSI
ncbi:hypothetical protein [Dactylosporangium matsuzakiense]|uniref:Uncharacterized protein n=1 Tax=Dactylosporangium matsuzakiense TaxID=53360 RepID=A0A9W6KEN3_9ACTN|nr:hypothetical protein [Dactylosporangium matsuzakiense]GLK99897.1 hypothetical protein GCM10017581_016380 [Dactylosporangium matsuzakiense]